MRYRRMGIRGSEAADEVADDGADDPDLDILRRVGEGDSAACAALVDRHLGRLLILGERMLGSRAEAEEVAQETFIRAWRTAPEWRSGRARFSTWLHRVALNLCRDRLRRRREVGLDAAGDPAGDHPHPGSALQRGAVAARVEAALAALPERQRAAIVLCHFEELGNVAAAAILEVSVEALESLLARGRRHLRALLADEAADLVGDM